MSLRYWWIVPLQITHNEHVIAGLAGERVVLHTRRLVPDQELEAMCAALNDIPMYHSQAEVVSPVHA